MYERFTDRARKVMQLANQEAQRFEHEYIGTEHILLGLVKEGTGVAVNVLKNLDMDLRKIPLEVEKIITEGPDSVTKGKLPHTPRAKKVIEYAIYECRDLNHNYVGTEHLLLGLMREKEGVAAQVLMNLGLDLAKVRDEVLSLLGHGLSSERPAPSPSQSLTQPPWPISFDAQEVRRMAEDEAKNLDHGNLCTAHFLIGLIRCSDGIASKLLLEQGVTADTARKEFEGLYFEFPFWTRGDLPLTSSLLKALEAATEEAKQRSQNDRELEAEIEKLQLQKEQAVANSDFEKAANLRDRIDTFERKLPYPPWRIEPKHLLLSILRDSDCAAVRILQNLGLDPEQLRQKLSEVMKEK